MLIMKSMTKKKNRKGNATYVSVNLTKIYPQKGYDMEIHVNKYGKSKCICVYLSTLHIWTDKYPVCICKCVSVFVSSMFIYVYRVFKHKL